MSIHRLYIDIPLTGNLDEAAIQSKQIVNKIQEALDGMRINGSHFNYRLGHDDDRQRSNYLDINENGHCSNKKSRVPLG